MNPLHDQPVPPTPLPQGPAPARPVKVMLVDDNAILADALPLVLRADPRFIWSGWVSGATDVVESVARAAPDIVLMDVDVPNVDTFALVRRLVEAFAATRIVMFSGHVRPEYIEAAFDAGAFGYLHKDDDFSDLLASLLKVYAGEIVMSPPVRQIMWRS